MRHVKSLASLAALLLVLAACGDDDAGAGGAATTGDAAAPLVCDPLPPPQKPAASCDVTIDFPAVATNVQHRPIGTPLTYCTTPPSSGDHYAIWAAFKEYDKPIEWPYLVHDLEHGAILLLYKCDGPCPEILDALRRVRDSAAVDPLCDADTQKRIIIAPAPSLETKVAAAAWDAIYRAPCADVPTLEAFVRDHYRKGPEDLCSPGQSF